jgi:simple sugar transport system permease protein
MVGLLAGAFAGALMGWILAVFAIKYVVNQVVLGVVLNEFAAGLTGFLYDAFMQPHTEALNTPEVLNPINIPVLSSIPVLGPLFFQANIVVYLAYVLIVVVDVWLFRTRWGLRSRAVGEHPRAAETVGIDVIRLRYRNVMLGGVLAGLGGAFLSMEATAAFQPGMTVGKGFIGLAAMIVGRWTPIGAFGAAVLFASTVGIAQSILIAPPSGQLGDILISLPPQFFDALPYLVTIIILAGVVGRSIPPAADGQPYEREAAT